jgi:hypothetical protein
MLQCLGSADPFLRVLPEHLQDQVFRRKRHFGILIEPDVHQQVQLHHLLPGLRFERVLVEYPKSNENVVQKHLVENHPEAEDVAFLAVHFLAVLVLQNFRRYVPRSATTVEHVPLLLDPCGQPEVRDHNIEIALMTLIFIEQVLRLQVAMHNSLGTLTIIHFTI